MGRLAVISVFTALATGGAAAQAGVGETDLDAHLSSGRHYPAAHGHSEYERAGARREADVTVSGIPGLEGRRVVVFISRTRVGTMRVSSTGRAHREWKTSRGQSVPFAATGSPVRVRTRGGTLIASGRYRLEVDSD